MLRRVALFVLLMLSISLTSHSQVQARRVALVIGNDSYVQVSRLENARSDATAIALALERAGFKVTLKTDTDLSGFKSALRSFKADVRANDEVIFYFSGHGVELAGSNYLLPIDVKGESEDQIRDDAVPLQRVLEDLQERKARFTLAILDACRNNPFRSGGRAIGGRGLAPTTAATGQMVFYSAGAGQQALDQLGPGDPIRNGVFTRVLLKEMETPGVHVAEVLRNVREEVAALAKSVGKEQVPAIYDQSLGRFFFTPATAKPATPTAPQLPTRTDETTIDLAFWDAIKSSTLASDYDDYLKQFPSGRFASLAKSRRDRLTATTAVSQSGIPSPATASTSLSAPVANVQQAERIVGDASDNKAVNVTVSALPSLTTEMRVPPLVAVSQTPAMNPAADSDVATNLVPKPGIMRGRQYFAKGEGYEIEVDATDAKLTIKQFVFSSNSKRVFYKCGLFGNSISYSANFELKGVCSSSATGIAVPSLRVSGIFPFVRLEAQNNMGFYRNNQLLFIESERRIAFELESLKSPELSTEQFARHSTNPS